MKLFVGNLPFSMSSEQLQQTFEEAGFKVDNAQVVTDRESGRSRGFGFVETPDGQQAIDAMAGRQFNGRALTVNEARPREDRPRFGGNRDGGYRGNRAR